MVLLATPFFMGIMLGRAQDSVRNGKCDSIVKIQYDKITREDRRSNGIEKSNKKSFVVKFMSEFRDSIRVYVNNKLEFNDYVNSDEVTGDSNKVFGYDYSNSSENVVLKFESRERGICCLVNLNKKYKIIYVFIDKTGNWIVRFSNVHYIH